MDTNKLRLVDFWQKNRIIKDKRLIEAFMEVDREQFILPEYLNEAYSDYPLPIGHGQTISQPTTIMMMIEALGLKENDTVLEIGAGSGYNAAIMSRLCTKIYSVEIIKELAKLAKDNLKLAKINNVAVINSDGSVGLKKYAPYDKIMVTAAAPKIPDELTDQLKEGGIIVIPVGDYVQNMLVGNKIGGKMSYHNIGEFRFVELKGKKGF